MSELKQTKQNNNTLISGEQSRSVTAGKLLPYLHLDHKAPLPAQLHHVAVDVHSALGLQPLHHGIDANVSARPAHSGAAHTHTHTQSQHKMRYVCRITCAVYL